MHKRLRSLLKRLAILAPAPLSSLLLKDVRNLPKISGVNLNIYVCGFHISKKKERKFHDLCFFQQDSPSNFPSTSGLTECVSECMCSSVPVYTCMCRLFWLGFIIVKWVSGCVSLLLWHVRNTKTQYVKLSFLLFLHYIFNGRRKILAMWENQIKLKINKVAKQLLHVAWKPHKLTIQYTGSLLVYLSPRKHRTCSNCAFLRTAKCCLCPKHVLLLSFANKYCGIETHSSFMPRSSDFSPLIWTTKSLLITVKAHDYLLILWAGFSLTSDQNH